MKHFPSFIFLLFASMPVFCQDMTRQDADSVRNVLAETKPGIDRINLLIKLAEYQVFKPGELKVDFDSAQTYLNEAAQINKSVRSTDADAYRILTEAQLINEKGQREEAKKMIEKLIAMLESGNHKTHLGKAYYDLSMYYDYWDDEQSEKKVNLLEKALAAYQQTGNTEGRAHTLKMLADIYGNFGEFQKGIELLRMALAAYDSVKYTRLQGAYALLGSMYRYQNDFKQALTNELKALKMAEAFHDTTMQMCQIHNLLGGIYKEVGRYELAIQHFKAALEIAKRFDNRSDIILLIMNVAGMYNSADRSQEALGFLNSLPKKYLESDNVEAQCYLYMTWFTTYVIARDYDKAKLYCDKLLKVAEDSNIQNDVAIMDNIHRSVARYYVESGQYSNALIYLKANSDRVAKLGDPKRIAAMEKLWYKVDSAQGNFRSAFKHLLLYRDMNESVYNISRQREIQLIQVEFETEIKDDSLQLQSKDIQLLTKDNSIKQAKFERAAFFRNITIAGIVLTLIIIGLLYKQYRQKQQTNRVISGKNEQLQHLLTEKEWLLKEIHHRVKNNLQVVMSLLSSQSAYIENDVALTAINDSQHRVHAMSLIHQKLYNSDNVSSIGMPAYIRELVNYLRDCFNTGQRIRFEFNTEPLELDVSQAVPLGLILNEAITNSIKYAFPGDRDGVITISLLNTSLNHYLLTIADNGIGMPAGLVNKKGSLGMILMSGLSEDLDGKFSIESNNGTTIKISFVHDLAAKRSDTFTKSFVTTN